MSGFDAAALDAAFFPDGRFRSNFVVNRIIQEIRSGRWGVGGKPLTTEQARPPRG